MDDTIYVRDNSRFIIGWCKKVGDRVVATHYSTGYAGYYSKASDITFDKNGSLYCYGDGTQSLIRDIGRK